MTVKSCLKHTSTAVGHQWKVSVERKKQNNNNHYLTLLIHRKWNCTSNGQKGSTTLKTILSFLKDMNSLQISGHEKVFQMHSFLIKLSVNNKKPLIPRAIVWVILFKDNFQYQCFVLCAVHFKTFWLSMKQVNVK